MIDPTMSNPITTYVGPNVSTRAEHALHGVSKFSGVRSSRIINEG